MTQEELAERFPAMDAETVSAVAELLTAARSEGTAAAEQAHALEKRFAAAVAGRRFVHPLVEEDVRRRFGEAAQDAAEDAALIERLTADTGCFAAPVEMPALNPALTAGDPEMLSDAAYYASIGLGNKPKQG